MMNFAPVGILLIVELIIAFIVIVGAISSACYIVVRVCYKAKSDALKNPALEREVKTSRPGEIKGVTRRRASR